VSGTSAVIEGWMWYPFPDVPGNHLFSVRGYVSKRYGVDGKLVRVFGFMFWIVEVKNATRI